MKFQSFVLGLTLIECLGIVIIIMIRCFGDPDMDQCHDMHGKSVSYLLDWRWLRNLAAVLLGVASFLNIYFAFYLLYPENVNIFWGRDWYFRSLRILHSVGFIAVASVAVFDLNNYHDLHMWSAGWLFIFLSIECELILFLPGNKCNVQKLLGIDSDSETLSLSTWISFVIQIIHAQLNWIFILLYVQYDIGIYEWLGIWGILLYLNYFSRDHWDIDIVVFKPYENPETNSSLISKEFKLNSSLKKVCI
jgi:hypothetical protein